MILLVGGTSESSPLACALLELGYSVLFSMATDTELELPHHEHFSVRRGRLNREEFCTLIQSRNIQCVIDASHPFAQILREELRFACLHTKTHRIRYERSEIPLSSNQYELARDHNEAAERAFLYKVPVLLTTGSRFLAPYCKAFQQTGTPLYARILPGEESIQACIQAGLPLARVEFARGPFSVAQNCEVLQRWKIGVLVTKNSGLISGLSEKLQAAQILNIPSIIIQRPEIETNSVSTFSQLHSRLIELPSSSSGYSCVA